MNPQGWLDPITGLPPVRPYREFVPEPGSPKPIYRDVYVNGTVASDVGDGLSLELAGITISGPGGAVRHALWGERLVIDFGLPLVPLLGHLRAGARVSLCCDITGYLAPHLRQKPEWAPRGRCTHVFWTVPPPPN